MIPVPYKVRVDHQIPIPYKVWGTIRVIDSYKLPTEDSNHIIHVGGWNVLDPKDWGLYFTFWITVHGYVLHFQDGRGINVRWHTCCVPNLWVLLLRLLYCSS